MLSNLQNWHLVVEIYNKGDILWAKGPFQISYVITQPIWAEHECLDESISSHALNYEIKGIIYETGI